MGRAQMLQVHPAPMQRQRHLPATSGVTQGHCHTQCAPSLHLINCVRNAHTAPVHENTESRAVSWGGRRFCLEGSKSKARGSVHLSRIWGTSGKVLGKINERWWKREVLESHGWKGPSLGPWDWKGHPGVICGGLKRWTKILFASAWCGAKSLLCHSYRILGLQFVLSSTLKNKKNYAPREERMLKLFLSN